MKTSVGTKILVALFFLSHLTLESAAQSNWQVENGNAFVEKQIILSSRSRDELYKDVYRWLISYFQNPEHLLQAKIQGEYLKGVVHVSEFVTTGSLSSADLHYTFTFNIKDDTVSLRLTDAFLLYPGSQDPDVQQSGLYRVEEFFSGNKKKKTNGEKEQMVAMLNKFSESLFNSLEGALLMRN